MAYGKIKADTLTWDNAGSDTDITISTIPTAGDLAAKADLASPALTGTPTAPTAAQGTNTTQLATTEFVNAEITADLAAAVGVSVQAYDADTAKLDVAQTFTAQQTFTELKETVYTLATSGSISLNPANGTVQSCVLTGNPSFTDALQSGQSLVLRVENIPSYTVTWFGGSITWVTSGGNVLPTFTAKDTLVFWKISSTLYGAYVGSYV